MTPDCSTCGYAVEWGRSAYISSWRLFRDRPDIITRGRYYFAPPDTPFFPGEHNLYSGVWTTEAGQTYDGLGEVVGGPRPYSKGSLGFAPPPAVLIGSESCLSGGEAVYPVVVNRTLPGGIDSRCYTSAGLAVPMQPQGGMQFWHRPDTLPVLSDLDPIPLWKDASGYANHLAQPDPSQAFLYSGNDLAGLPAAVAGVTGTVPHSMAYYLGRVPLGTKYTVYVVAQLGGTLGVYGPGLLGIGSGTYGPIAVLRSEINTSSSNSVHTFTVPIPVGTAHVWCVRRTGNQFEVSIDGVSMGTASANPTGVAFASQWQVFLRSFAGLVVTTLSEMIGYDWTVTDLDHAANVAYFRGKYGF